MSHQEHTRFVYHQTVDAVDHNDLAVSGIAAAIGEPARARMLYQLMDGRARTGTELAILAEISPSTASVHLHRLKSEHLVKVTSQGKHRYYSLHGPQVAHALESLSVLAGAARTPFRPSTPARLRSARTCYDHIAGAVGVLLHDQLQSLGWLSTEYELTISGADAFGGLGIDIPQLRSLRRRFACPCLDWSERRPHLGGALGAAVFEVSIARNWLSADLDSRALSVTASGKRELLRRFGLDVA